MSTGRVDEAKNYSKQEILELIVQTKKKYGISATTDLGDILGGYNHNWHYYYENKAKNSPAFLEALLSVQNPFEMFERIKQRTTELMKKKSMSKKDMNQICFYIDRMISCLIQIGDQVAEDIDKIGAEIVEMHDADRFSSAVNVWKEQMEQDMKLMLLDMMYLIQVGFFLGERRMQRLHDEVNARNKGKENFDLTACYEAHYGTLEFELSRMKDLNEEQKKAACCYKIRCNSIKKCKVHQYAQKLDALKECGNALGDAFQEAAGAYCEQTEVSKIFANVCKLLAELELPVLY